MKLVVSYRENDDLDIYLEIHAGAGGTESKTGQICCRMHSKWFDSKILNMR